MMTPDSIILAGGTAAVAALVALTVWYPRRLAARDRRLDAAAIDQRHTGELPRTFFTDEPPQRRPRRTPAGAARPTIQRIAADLTAAIAARRIEDVPTIAQLKARYRASDYAVRRALSQLKASGLIENRGHPRGRHVLTAWARLFPDLVTGAPTLAYVI